MNDYYKSKINLLLGMAAFGKIDCESKDATGMGDLFNKQRNVLKNWKYY